MEHWICPRCLERITGSLNVVLLLASVHRCRTLDGSNTLCVDCLNAPTGLCTYHTYQKVVEKAISIQGVVW